MLTEDEVNRADAVFYGTDGTLVQRWRAVCAWFAGTLAARDGTMTADEFDKTMTQVCDGNTTFQDAQRLEEHQAALGARNAVLEADLNTSAAEVGRLTSLLAEREGASILDKNAIRLQRERADAAETERNNAWAVASQLEAAVEEQFQEKTRLQERANVLEKERDTLRSELAEARATIARLTAVGQALSEHADRTAGEPT